MLRTADTLAVRVPQMPRLTRPDQTANQHAVHELRSQASRAARAPDAPRLNYRLERTPATTMLGGRVQHPFLRGIRGSLAARTAKALMRGMGDVLNPIGVAPTDAERLPAIRQSSIPVPALAAEPTISVHRSKCLPTTLTRPNRVHSDLTGRKIHGGGELAAPVQKDRVVSVSSSPDIGGCHVAVFDR